MATEITPIRVLLVDDHAVVRAGYRMLLQNSPEVEIVAEAGNGEAAYRSFAQHRPDVVIMDLSLPGMSGFEVIRRIIARDSTARVLVFSIHEDTAFVEQALKAGARGYITKNSAPDTLLEAVKEVSCGNLFLDRELAQRIALEKACGRDSVFGVLSTREFEIFRLIGEGLSTAEVSLRLNLSNKTVANYATQIKNKLRVQSKSELIRLAIRHGVVEV